MAVDAFGNIIYSTETTLLGDFGTARKAYQPIGLPDPEVKLFVEQAVFTPSDNFWAMAHIDSIGTTFSVDTTVAQIDTTVVPADTTFEFTGQASLTFFDHLPGDESVILTGDAGPNEDPIDAWQQLRLAGSDAFIVDGARWNIESVGFSDTTFIARSEDREFVLIGEGATSPVGRVLMYSARENEVVSLSAGSFVGDLLLNASTPVRGVAVNYDGTLAAARADRVAFFDQRLRLSGQADVSNPEVSAGVTFHPLHANQLGLDNPAAEGGVYDPNVHLAFVSSGDRTIDIIDTFEYITIGQVTIRDIVTGPLKAILPFPEDNAGLRCATTPVFDRSGTLIGDAVQLYNGGSFSSPIVPDGITEDNCIVLKVYATTSAGGVVVVPIRKADILRDHPVRIGN